MTKREELLSLAERCEKAKGPNLALMCAAYKEVFPEASSGAWDAIDAWNEGYNRFCGMLDAGASLDAAMSLVPENGFCEINWYRGRSSDGKDDATVWTNYGYEFCEHSKAATPALALCAAALRAHASMVTV